MTFTVEIAAKDESLLTFMCGHNLEQIPYKEIIRLEADGSYTYMYTIKCKYTFSRHIGWVQEKYFKERKEFLKIHEAHIINRAHLLKYEKGIFYMSDGTTLHVAKRRKSFIRKVLLAC